MVPVNKGGDAVRRLDESIFGRVGEDETHMVLTEVVRTPGVHGRARHVFFLAKPTAKVTGTDAERLDVGDEEIASVWNNESHAVDRSQPGDERVAAPLVSLHGR